MSATKKAPNLVTADTGKIQVSESPPDELSPSKRGDELVLRFSTKAWLKMMHCRDCYTEEIAAYAITAGEDLLYVDDIWIPKQEVSAGSFEFDADHTAECIDWFFSEYGVQPYQCSRIWIHTHPSGVNGPSGTDEDTFATVFGDFTWSIMVIFPKQCETPYAALTIRAKGLPEFRTKLPVRPDYSDQATEIDLDTLKDTIQENVSTYTYVHPATAGRATHPYGDMYGWDDSWDYRTGGNYARGYEEVRWNRGNDDNVVAKDHETDEDGDAILGEHWEPEDYDEEYPWTGDCDICHDQGVRVNEDNFCAKCMAEFTILEEQDTGIKV